MPLNELLIASHWWNKKQDREVFNNQFLAYHSIVGPHLNPKNIPPTFEKFAGGKEDKPKVKATERQKELMLADAAEYYKKNKQRI